MISAYICTKPRISLDPFRLTFLTNPFDPDPFMTRNIFLDILFECVV